MCTRPDKCRSEGGDKRALIINPPRVPCPFFPEGRKVMGEEAGGETDPRRSVSRFGARGCTSEKKVRWVWLSRRTEDLGRREG